MENYAIVIGINKYERFDRNLEGCVNDAIEMKDWFLNPEGGKVKPENLTLCLSRDGQEEEDCKPTTEKIQDVIYNLKEITKNNPANRLFLYYAGHGFCNKRPGTVENVIMPSDYNDDAPNLTTLEIQSIIDFCASLNFKEQIFFFDSCRNFPSRRPFRVGHFKEPPTTKNPNLKQHVFYATSLGSEAVEAKLDGEEGGLFTRALLKGLKGYGNSKNFVALNGRYEVRGERLVKYIKNEMKKYLRQNSDEVGNFATPDLFGNPLLATFPDTKFDKVDLEIEIRPENISQDVKIKIMGGEAVQSPHPTPSPWAVELLQSDYGISASLDGYEPNKKPYGVELYSEKNIRIEMTPYPTRNTNSGNSKGSLVIKGEDPTAMLEIVDANKEPKGAGRNEIEVKLDEGLYYARMRNDDYEHEELVVLNAGERVEKTLEFSENIDFGDSDSNFVLVRRSLEDSSFKQQIKDSSIATVITMASRTKPYEQSENAFGLLSPINAMTERGLHLIVGSDVKNENDSFVNNLKIKIWGQDESKANPKPWHLKRFEGLEGFGELAKELIPGHYWMSLESHGQQPVIFSIFVSINSITYVILQQDKNGKSRIFQYLPLINPRNEAGLEFKDEVSAIRQMDVVQKYYQSDIQKYFFKDAINVAYSKWHDPMAGLIAGNLMLRNRGQREEHSLEEISRNMTGYYNEISDSHVLQGRYLSSINEEKSRKAFLTAIKRGIPIFAENLEVLYYEIKKKWDFADYDEDEDENMKIKVQRNSELIKIAYEKRIRGTLWTCYVP